MPHGKREEGTVAKVVSCRVEVSTATQTNRTAVPKSFSCASEVWNKFKIFIMSVLTVILVIMFDDYHYVHDSDYGGGREGASPETIRCPTKLGIWRDCWDPASQATIPFVELRENRHERHRHKRPAKRSH